MNTDAEQEVLSHERRALERWSRGDPLGFLEAASADVTYFDDIGAHTRLEGSDAFREYLSSLQGQIPPHAYEVQDPKVQLYGDTAILTLRYAPSSEDGTPLTPWKATSVYHREDEGWRMVHAHWSLVKES
jgi:hypothetical protein